MFSFSYPATVSRDEQKRFLVVSRLFEDCHGREQRLNNSEVARRLGVTEAGVRRLLDPVRWG